MAGMQSMLSVFCVCSLSVGIVFLIEPSVICSVGLRQRLPVGFNCDKLTLFSKVNYYTMLAGFTDNPEGMVLGQLIAIKRSISFQCLGQV